ncbi:MAG TPA: hypothetical protein VN968_21615 [Bradyrhizobium sp.]|jgi:hypothetical protein|nr:hypothetical protein [Bradyrhizobium sp.]
MAVELLSKPQFPPPWRGDHGNRLMAYTELLPRVQGAPATS